MSFSLSTKQQNQNLYIKMHETRSLTLCLFFLFFFGSFLFSENPTHLANYKSAKSNHIFVDNYVWYAFTRLVFFSDRYAVLLILTFAHWLLVQRPNMILGHGRGAISVICASTTSCPYEQYSSAFVIFHNFRNRKKRKREEKTTLFLCSLDCFFF